MAFWPRRCLGVRTMRSDKQHLAEIQTALATWAEVDSHIADALDDTLPPDPKEPPS